MAIRKEVFFEARVPEFWQGALSDDYALSQAVHAAGFSIAYAPGALTPCGEHITAGRFFGWIYRQMAITRIYAPRLWWPGLIAHIFYCGGMAASVIASIRGNRLAEWALIAQVSPGMLKGLNRAKPVGGVGADRAGFARDAERPESRDARQGIAARARGVVQAARVGARHLGTPGHMGLADRAGVVGLREEHRVARAAVCVEARRQELGYGANRKALWCVQGSWRTVGRRGADDHTKGGRYSAPGGGCGGGGDLRGARDAGESVRFHHVAGRSHEGCQPGGAGSGGQGRLRRREIG